MVVHRTNSLNNKCTSELIIIMFFLLSNGLGSFGFLYLIYLRCKISSVKIYTKGFPFLKLKLILLYIFGVGYMFHSGLYVWKHTFPEDCSEYSWLNCIYEILSMLYIFIIFVYFALIYNRKFEPNIRKHYIVLTFIVTANVCIWLNAIAFESNFLNGQLANSTKPLNTAEVAIDKIDTFCSPAMVEFSLMVIDIMFTENHSVAYSSNWNLYTSWDKNKPGKKILLMIVQIALSFLALAFFAFVFTVVLITKPTDELLDYPVHFSVYICFELIIKLIMLASVSVCFLIDRKNLKCKINASSAVLILTTICNVLYHIVYCVFLIRDGFKKPNAWCKGLSLIVNIVSIILAILQTRYIIGINSNYFLCSRFLKLQKWPQTNFVYYASYVLAVFNLGLWICDSVGEDRSSVFNALHYWAHKNLVSSILYTAFFPITIFFRFQTGLEFLEFFWEHKTVPHKRRHSDSELSSEKLAKTL